MINKLLNRLAGNHLTPTQLQTLWEKNTRAGREYSEYRQREIDYANITPRLDVRNLTDALTDNHWQFMGIENGDFIAVSRYVKADAEIEIHVHRGKGDLYGVFRKVNETRTEVLIEQLTVDKSKEWLNVLAADLNSKVIALQPLIADAVNDNAATEIERTLITVLKNCQDTLRYAVTTIKNNLE